MAQLADHAKVFELTGGRLCLDFANTLAGSRGSPKEYLASYRDLVFWGRQAGVLSGSEAEHLTEAARRRPADAAKVLAEAVGLRETIFRIFAAVIAGREPEQPDLSALGAGLSRAMVHLRVLPRAGGYAWGWADDREHLHRVIWPVVRSAAELLVSGEASRVGRCAGEGCDWLFMDTSHNRSRRWCDMRSCGNRAKARRHHARKKERP
jgi:predicted RNA-binding Zn ribbon-like protein